LKNLQILFVGQNRLLRLPWNIEKMAGLRNLNISKNARFRELPYR